MYKFILVLMYLCMACGTLFSICVLYRVTVFVWKTVGSDVPLVYVQPYILTYCYNWGYVMAVLALATWVLSRW